MMLKKLSHWSAAAVIGMSSFNAHAGFSITLNFTGGLSATEQSYFTAAKSFWESVIAGYSVGSLSGVTINASGFVGALGGVLGSAGPDVTQTIGAYKFTTTGSMEFDTVDIPNIGAATFTEVVKHEMAHVLGFGTLWTDNGLYSMSNPGQFNGANALAQYKVEYNQPSALFVPVELGGGLGTAHGHWNEVDGGGVNTGIVDSSNRDMRFELMTGWIDAPGTYVSRTTIASFQDLGYVVNLSAVPEPGTLALWLLGVPVLARLASRRRVVA